MRVLPGAVSLGSHSVGIIESFYDTETENVKAEVGEVLETVHHWTNQIIIDLRNISVVTKHFK